MAMHRIDNLIKSTLATLVTNNKVCFALKLDSVAWEEMSNTSEKLIKRLDNRTDLTVV